ncbi:MAG: FAD-dependent oxidoreductase [Actinobacteria bacterium]|nr:FAD-dependent oxidoreductase [Actinomycetota bacterium]
MGNKPVIVIGAGCAGLAAAYTLKNAGADVLVLEAGDRPGGRCWSMRREGFLLPIGAGLTETQWAVTHRFVRELGMAGQAHDVKTMRVGFWRNGRLHFILKGTPLQMIRNIPETLRFRGWPLKAYPQAAKLGLAMWRQMRKLDPVTRDFEPLLELGNVSSAQFALEHGGPEILDHFVAPVLGTMVLARPEEVTISHLIALAFLAGGVCVMENGMGSINEGLYERVKDVVRLSTPVNKVVIEGKRVKGVETPTGFIEADQVICATDAVVAREIIPDLPDTIRKPLETCEYSSTYNYIFALEKKITPDYFVATCIPGSEGSILSTIFEIAGGDMKTAPEGAGLFYCFTGGWHDEALASLSEDERRRAVIREVQKFWPQFPDEPYFTECIRWDRAINLESPGQFPAIHEFLKHHYRDVEGLYLAGEYLFLIACTEGAFATGVSAAEMALGDM